MHLKENSIKMKNYSAKKLAIIISLCFTICGAASHVVELWLSPGMSRIVFIAIFSIVMFIVAVLLLNYVFNKYIVRQLQPIYSTIESIQDDRNEMKLSSDDSDEDLNKVISQVNEDVARWAKEKTKEISELKSNEKYRKDYLGDVAHELRTPLFIISGYIESLIDGGWEDREVCTKYLDRTANTVERMIAIVNDLSTIAKFDENAIKLNIEEMDLVPIVNEVLTLNKVRAREKKITLNFIPPKEGKVMVLADKVKIYEVLTNLVVNSINYGNENGQTTISIFDIENKWLIDVEDNGIGISEANIPRIFERFFRADKARSSNTGGTGLGLAIVKHIIESHGEVITVTSRLGEGTKFSFTLKKVDKYGQLQNFTR